MIDLDGADFAAIPRVSLSLMITLGVQGPALNSIFAEYCIHTEYFQEIEFKSALENGPLT